jgi:hypothetical protein
MTAPNAIAGGGYLIAGANAGEPMLIPSATPTAWTGAAVTLTAAALMNDLNTFTAGGGAITATLPTVALLEAALIDNRVGIAFDFTIINNDTANNITVATAAGWTLSGQMQVLANTGTQLNAGRFRAQKTAGGIPLNSTAAAWTLYRLG